MIENYYIEKGQGFPFILLHGNGEDHSYFERQIDYFSKHYRVIAIDTRGHGQTERGERPFTISQFADDLNVFMEKHGINKAHILGFSDGGNIALVFALNHPEKIDRLILNGANLFPAGVKRSAQIPIEIGYIITSFFAKRFDGAKKKAEMLGLMVNDPNIAPEELETIRAKTLIIAGTKDLILEEHSRLISQKIPNSSLAFIDGDHFVAAKNPEVFNRAVESFLNNQ